MSLVLGMTLMENNLAERIVETAERIAVLELEVKNLKDAVDSTNSKLDELLELKSKGLGAFWLLSILCGSGILGAIAWLKGLL